MRDNNGRRFGALALLLAAAIAAAAPTGLPPAPTRAPVTLRQLSAGTPALARLPDATTTTTAPPSSSTTTTTVRPAGRAAPSRPAAASKSSPPAARTPARPAAATTAQRRTSTGYCLTGRMADGRQVHDGAVASRDLPLGSAWTVLDGPLAGRTFTVEDRGPGASFDVWMPSCGQATAYGRRTVTLTRAGA